jgi:hypothetical protein
LPVIAGELDPTGQSLRLSGRTTISPTSTSGGWAMAKAIVQAWPIPLLAPVMAMTFAGMIRFPVVGLLR